MYRSRVLLASYRRALRSSSSFLLPVRGACSGIRALPSSAHDDLLLAGAAAWAEQRRCLVTCTPPLLASSGSGSGPSSPSAAGQMGGKKKTKKSKITTDTGAFPKKKKSTSVVARSKSKAAAVRQHSSRAAPVKPVQGEETGEGEVVEHDARDADDEVDSAAPPPAMGEAEEVEMAAEVCEVADFANEEGEASADPAQRVASMPSVGSLLDFESPLNLRLATLTRQHGKAFRAMAVHMPVKVGSVNFDVTFEDIASGARLVCKLDEVKTRYTEWATMFRASFIAVFLPTLQSPNAILLMNAIANSRPARPPPPPGSYHPRLNEDPDHLFFSYTKLREVVAQKRKEVELNPQLLTVTIMNAYAEEWKNFIFSPGSCHPQSFLTSTFNFQPSRSGTGGGVSGGPAPVAALNKDLLHSQLSTAAETLMQQAAVAAGSGGGKKKASTLPATSYSTPSSGHTSWNLIFVSAPGRTSAGMAAIPPMQDLLTGQFVQPLSLSERHVVYIIGTGTAAESFAHFPLPRKGRAAFSLLLEDVESQLGLQRPHRCNLTTVLTQALDSFSRITWMGLMKEETGVKREPHPNSAFYRLQRRQVQREILPSFLESVFAPASRYGAGLAGMPGPSGGAGLAGAAAGRPGGSHAMEGGPESAVTKRALEQHIQIIFNNPERLEREKKLRDSMRSKSIFFVHITSASVTAARRADNPFSARNGLVDVVGQLWRSLDAKNPPPITHLTAEKTSSGEVRSYVHPDSVLPADLPLGPPDAKDPKTRAENAVLVGWDVKRVLLFLRDSPKLKTFLSNGGKIWCGQYAQYLLKGFNHLNLATMERTLLQCHDGPLTGPLQPMQKLKVIFETQLEVALGTRQLNSILHRMDGLLASAEMEQNGLQLAPQSTVTHFSNMLRLERERLEKVLQQKTMDFTQQMDDDVRQRINFRSPQDISSIIYGGGLCRHLGSRFVPVRPTRYPVTALFPQLVCNVTGTPMPAPYGQVDSFVSSTGASGSAGTNLYGKFPEGYSAADAAPTPENVNKALAKVKQLSKRCTMEQVLSQTAVVVLMCKVKLGGFVESVSLYCPNPTGGKDEAPELRVRVAVDDVLPVAERPDVVTVAQLKSMIAKYPPLLNALAAPAASAQAPVAPKMHGRAGKHGKHASSSSSSNGDAAAAAQPDLRNILIITNCVHEKLEPLVDTGIIAAIRDTVLGARQGGPGVPSIREEGLVERVCFADINKAFPPPQQSGDSFESDFSELSVPGSNVFSSKANWDAQAQELMSLGGLEGTTKAMISHCASVMGTARDAFRNTHPLASTAVQGLHGQEQASTTGMLWQVTPPNLHPLLRRFLRGKAASSGADAMERVTVLLSPYSDIDLSFFSALQQLRFTEKKMQLFEEGCLFRAVLPECHDRVHGELCHCVTATGRLSSQSPNLQNIPKEEDLRRLIVSRFGKQGIMIEADYSQLEVVVLAALSRDAKMLEELRANVDFHCLRVSLMTKEPYEDVVRKAKVEKDPQYIQLRQQAKVFSFQRQYGAGVSTISTTTGLTEQEVEQLIAAEDQHYKNLNNFYKLVTACVGAGTDRLLRLRTLDTALWNANTRRVVMLTEPMHYFVVPTGSKFDFSKDKKSVPRLKNYPVQGVAGEIVQVVCGRIVREFLRRKNYNNKAFLVNTVHDCVWVDAHESVAAEVKKDLDRIMGNTDTLIKELWPEMKLDVPFKVEIHAGPSLGELSK